MAVHSNNSIKLCVMNDKSSMLWHWRSGHISTRRIKRLVNDRILELLDVKDFDSCVDCIKEASQQEKERYQEE